MHVRGVRDYWWPWPIYGIIGLSCTAEIIMMVAGFDKSTDAWQYWFAIFQFLRFLRVFRLLRMWPVFTDFVSSLISAAEDIGYFVLLTLVYIFIMALIGVVILGGKMVRCVQYLTTFIFFVA